MTGSKGSRRSAERAAETRERLLRATLELAAEVGWGRVTARLVATRAGLSPGLIVHHFQSMENLLREAAVSVLDARLASLAAAIDGSDEDKAALDFLDRLPMERRADLLLETAGRVGRDSEVQDRARGSYRWLEDRLRRRLERAPDQDSLRSDLEPGEMALLILCALDGLLVREAFGLEADAEFVTRILRAVLTR